MGALIKSYARCGTFVTRVETVGMLSVGVIVMLMFSVELSGTFRLRRWRASFARACKALNSVADKYRKEVSEAVGWAFSTMWKKRPDVPALWMCKQTCPLSTKKGEANTEGEQRQRDRKHRKKDSRLSGEIWGQSCRVGWWNRRVILGNRTS